MFKYLTTKLHFLNYTFDITSQHPFPASLSPPQIHLNIANTRKRLNIHNLFLNPNTDTDLDLPSFFHLILHLFKISIKCLSFFSHCCDKIP